MDQRTSRDGQRPLGSNLEEQVRVLQTEIEQMKENLGSRLLTVNQAADLLSCSRPTVYKFINCGALNAVEFLSDKRIRFKDLQALLRTFPPVKRGK